MCNQTTHISKVLLLIFYDEKTDKHTQRKIMYTLWQEVAPFQYSTMTCNVTLVELIFIDFMCNVKPFYIGWIACWSNKMQKV